MARVEILDADLESIDQLSRPDAAIAALLERLPAQQRDAVRARVLAERSYPEIASEMVCSESVIRNV